MDKNLIKTYLKSVFFLLILAWICFLSFLVLQENGYLPKISEKFQTIEQDVKNLAYKPIETKIIETNVNESTEVKIPENFKLEDGQTIPESVKVDLEKSKITFTPNKKTTDDFYLKFSGEKFDIAYKFKAKRAEVDWNTVEKEIRDYLGNQIENYSVYIYDLGRKEEFGINQSKQFAPASMAKLTVAVLVLRDVEAGKYTLDDTYPIQADFKFGSDDLALKASGTQVTFREYLEKMIIDSSNTAWYHLVRHLGNSYEVVNPRTIEELGVNPLFMDPHLGTAQNLGKVLRDIYTNKTLSEDSSQLLIELMENAVPSNREGVGLGVPQDVRFANKIGTLWTVDDISYQDSAIIFGKKTDYVLVIMNQQVEWIPGRERLRRISEIVYSHLDK